MTWSKIDDNLPDNPKLIDLQPAIQLIYVYSILYCHRNETDGFLDLRIANALLKRYSPGGTAPDLFVGLGLWESVDGGFRIHDYLKHQDSRDRIKEVREFNRKRQHKFRVLSVTRYEKDRNADVTVLDQSRSDQIRSENTNTPPTAVVGVSESQTKGNGHEKKPRFTPPTVAEVRSFCEEKHSEINPVEFVAFYESKGWKVGTAPMKNWKAAIATWEMRR